MYKNEKSSKNWLVISELLLAHFFLFIYSLYTCYALNSCILFIHRLQLVMLCFWNVFQALLVSTRTWVSLARNRALCLLDSLIFVRPCRYFVQQCIKAFGVGERREFCIFVDVESECDISKFSFLALCILHVVASLHSPYIKVSEAARVGLKIRISTFIITALVSAFLYCSFRNT